MTNMSLNIVKISRGYIDVPTHPKQHYASSVRRYCELWLNTATNHYQMCIYDVKGCSFSYRNVYDWHASVNRPYIYAWVETSFPDTSVNDICDTIIAQCGLRIWEEDVKFVSPSKEQVTQLVAYTNWNFIEGLL